MAHVDGVTARRLGVEEMAARLLRDGFVSTADGFALAGDAWDLAARVVKRAGEIGADKGESVKLETIGHFRMPPPGVPQRDFQALHLDFGLPLDCVSAVPVATFTALYVESAHGAASAATRLVPLGVLLRQRGWPAAGEIVSRLRDDAVTGSAVEGILARIVQTIDRSDDLPDPEAEGFLCGMEFATLEDERRYFLAHGLELEKAETEVVLAPGQLLVFDNTAVAHGRRGRRQTEELQQLCFGTRDLDRSGQRMMLQRFATLFSSNVPQPA